MHQNFKIKKYIFITFEGYTFQPDSESDIPDIENMQVIGFSHGKNAEEAFEILLLENSYLKDTTFHEVIARELANSNQEVFTIHNL
ncbi:MAG: hypothetical protein RBR59_06360 [Sulfurimonadaceae bacterium]|jgi:hypothetical protein|nr:hypothetical protein [Sulfurimonadaceae bacterium]